MDINPWPMRLSLILGLVFAGSAVYNITLQSWANVVAASVLAAALLFAYSQLRAAVTKRTQFLSWLAQNAAAVRAGGAQYQGVDVKLDTEVLIYTLCISCLLATFRVPSALLIRGAPGTAQTGFFFSGISLLLGWWGIPWGPIYTLKSVWQNSRGGQKHTVGELLSSLR